MGKSTDTRIQQALFVKRLLDWYKLNRRKFSWRERTLTPYEVLVLEILLRRTPAERVDKVFTTFIKKYPSPQALLKSSEQGLISDLKTLGLCRRVETLRELARQLVERWRGEIPRNVNELVQLPGVGIYAANAVLCFSYGRAVPIVDTNVARVLQRVFDFPSSGDPSRDKHLWSFVQRILPGEAAKEFNWALIDFGATLCRPKKPLCNKCPMPDLCSYIQQITLSCKNSRQSQRELSYSANASSANFSSALWRW